MRPYVSRTMALLLCAALCFGLAACTKIPLPSETSGASETPPQEPALVSAAPAEPEEPALLSAPTVLISELMPSNKSTIRDDCGLFPDWVELYNYGGESVSLGGLLLCCDEKSWPLPPLTLDAGAYLLLYCDGSGENGRADFRISKDGVTLALETKRGDAFDIFPVPACDADTSVTRGEDGSAVTTLLATPGFENSKRGYEQFQATLTCDSPLQINEVMVYNEWLLPQGNAYYDWVELKNVSDAPVELSGYCLSDSSGELGKYALPAFSLAPGDKYMVYCTGEEGVSVRGGGSAPFALDAQNEQLYLSLSDGTLCDWVHLHGIPYGGSCGRMDGQDGFFYFKEPTPKKDNSGGARCLADKPVLVGSDGVFNGVESVSVTLSAGGEIHYTLDGSAPTAESPLYTGPLTLTKSAVVRSVNIEEGRLTDNSLDLSYLINENHTLPVVSLIVNPREFGKLYNNPDQALEYPATVSYFGEDGSFSIGCGYKLHGATSKFVQDKKSFKLCFRSRYEGELSYDLFENGITDFSSILLRAAQESSYSSLMHDNLMHQLAIRCFPNLPAQDYRYCVLYVNGDYRGIYNIREAHSKAHYARHYGYDESSVSMWQSVFDRNSEMDKFTEYVINTSLVDDEVYKAVEQRLNIDSVIGWNILQAYCGNIDCSPSNVRYYYSSEDGKLSFALSDLDLGLYAENAFDVPYYGSYVHEKRYTYFYNNFVHSLSRNRQFQLQTAEQLSAALRGPMSDESVLALVDELADQLRPEIARDRLRWPVKGVSQTQANWEKLVDGIRDYVTANGGRARVMIKSFLKYSSLSEDEVERYFGDLIDE